MDEVPTDDRTPAPEGEAEAASRPSPWSVRGLSAEATAEISDVAAKATRQIRDSASSLAHEARDQFQDYLRAQMAAGLDLADEATDAARSFAEDLDEKSPHVARVVRAAADRAESSARWARDLTPGDLYAAAEDFAKRKPALFLAAAAGLGFLAARFLKASPPQEAPLGDAADGEDAHDA